MKSKIILFPQKAKKSALKEYRDHGLTSIKLNAAKHELEAEYNQIQYTLAVSSEIKPMSYLNNLCFESEFEPEFETDTDRPESEYESERIENKADLSVLNRLYGLGRLLHNLLVREKIG